MYCIRKPTDIFPLSPKLVEFGEYFVAITNTQKFVDRVKDAVQKAGYGGRAGPVSYFDHANYSGKTGPFMKSNKYEWQSEYRLLISPGQENPINLYIGDITDITTPIEQTSEIKSILNFSSEQAQEVGITW